MITIVRKYVLVVLVFFFLRAFLYATPAGFIEPNQTAAITGNAALFYNPSGLAFMGGTETRANYLYELSDLGNRHHAGIGLAANLFNAMTFAFGITTKAAFSDMAQKKLGTELSGILGGGLRLSDRVSFGMSFAKTYSFREQQARPWLINFGFQARPWSFLSFGAFYQEIDGAFFAAPNISYGISVRPFKELLTIGFDGKMVAKGKLWSQGFEFRPIVGLSTLIGGYGASVSTEFSGLNSFIKPIVSLALDLNFSYLGVSILGLINPMEHNFGVGMSLRGSTEAWPSITRPKGLWVELTIDSDGTLEQKPRSLPERFLSASPDPLSVLALLKRIERDQSVSGVVLNFNGFSFGDGRTQEWREALVALRQARKEVLVYLDNPSERDFYIATAADKILMNKQATLNLRHFQATLMYFADLLEKIGIKADAVVAGTYKTAPRRWTNARPQKEEIEVANNILNSFYETFLSHIAESRNIDRNALNTIFDQGEINADEAKRIGLIDELVSPNEGSKDLKERRRVQFVANYENIKFKRDSWDVIKKIVVIPVTDTIVDGRTSLGLLSAVFPVTGAQNIVDEIEEATEDADVIGIIVRIDSPGGDAAAGHRISHALKMAQKTKPVITSMSDVAASAGYLIAVGTQHILAMPNTITGSIGVFSLMFSGEKLAQKIGIFSKELSPIENPGPTLVRTITKTERQEAQKITDWYYKNFINDVSEGVKMSIDEVEKNAQGRVWLGKEALEKKLIHELGGFARSVEVLQTLAEVPLNEEVMIDVRSPGLSQQFSLSAGLRMLFKSEQPAIDLTPIAPLMKPYAKALEAYNLHKKPQARLPFDIEWQRK